MKNFDYPCNSCRSRETEHLCYSCTFNQNLEDRYEQEDYEPQDIEITFDEATLFSKESIALIQEAIPHILDAAVYVKTTPFVEITEEENE